MPSVFTREYVLIAARTETSSGVGDPIDVGMGGNGSFFLTITAASGTAPLLNVFVQEEMPDASWDDVVSFVQLGTTGRRIARGGRDVAAERATNDGALTAGTARSGAVLGRIRAKWTIAGVTPSFAFAVYVTADQGR